MRTRSNKMPILLPLICFALAALAQQDQSAAPAAPAQQGQMSNTQSSASSPLGPDAQNQLIRKVQHELIMLPYYNVFDNLVFRLDGRTVVLEGQVTNPTLKSDAGNVVKRIEGVDKVVNNIEALPPSPMDDRIRKEVYRSIYSYGPMMKYANITPPPIHIIVKNGRIALEGVVDSEQDKQLAGMRANQVPGTFQVTNNLRVVNSSNTPKQKK
jgi:hyperosmotically inducible periplasmic protein